LLDNPSVIPSQHLILNSFIDMKSNNLLDNPSVIPSQHLILNSFNDIKSIIVVFFLAICRALFWKKIAPRNLIDTVWTSIDEETLEIDVLQMETIFAKPVGKSKEQKKKEEDARKKKKASAKAKEVQSCRFEFTVTFQNTFEAATFELHCFYKSQFCK